jgi:gluconate 2-dehydrogenase gamma chain
MVQRRSLLVSAATVALSASIFRCAKPAAPFRLFNADEAGILAAIANQIVPDDEYTPGAVKAGVLRFLDRQLARAYAEHRETYRQGIAALDASARQFHGEPFFQLPHEVQEALMERMETGDLPESIWGDLPPREFFRLVRLHVMQGYYGDPRHGGNLNRVSWQMLGLPYPPVRGRDDYRLPAESGTLNEPQNSSGALK